MKYTNWKIGLNRIYAVILTLYYGYICIWSPLESGYRIRNYAFANLSIDDAEFDELIKLSSFQSRIKDQISLVFEEPVLSFLVLLIVPILLYFVPLLLFLIIRWVWRGFMRQTMKNTAEQDAP